MEIYQNSKCYAANLGDGCAQKITFEHFFSHALLKELNKGDGGLIAGGFHWMNPQGQKVSPKSLGSNILCEKHNSILSSLDTEFLNIHKSFKAAYDHVSKNKEITNIESTINGILLERLVLKILFGIIASGCAEKNGDLVDFKTMQPWLKVLFGKEPMPSRLGVYAQNEKSQEPFSEKIIGVTPVISERQVKAAHFDLHGFKFFLAMTLPETERSALSTLMYRPLYFDISDKTERYSARINFNWDHQEHGQRWLKFKRKN